MKKRKSTGTPANPTPWKILISADPKTGKLRYRDAKGNDLKRVFPSNGDTIQWKLDTGIQKQPFQISFSEVNPFNVGTSVSYRGNGTALSDIVNFNDNFVGSKVCKYTVTLNNGWFDDPDVVPVPADAGPRTLATKQSVVCLISWAVDPNGAITGIKLSNPTDLPSKYHQPVDWKWADDQQADTQEFTLVFDGQVPDCPQNNDSTGREIVLTPGRVAKTGFTVTVAGTTYEAIGTLTVT